MDARCTVSVSSPGPSTGPSNTSPRWRMGISKPILSASILTLLRIPVIVGGSAHAGVCAFRQGRIAERTRDAQQYRASGLNLVIAAIVWWNSTYKADAVDPLRAAGEPAPGDLLAHTSPVGWEHIAFSGDFVWEHAAAVPTGAPEADPRSPNARRGLKLARSDSVRP